MDKSNTTFYLGTLLVVAVISIACLLLALSERELEVEALTEELRLKEENCKQVQIHIRKQMEIECLKKENALIEGFIQDLRRIKKLMTIEEQVKYIDKTINYEKSNLSPDGN